MVTCHMCGRGISEDTAKAVADALNAFADSRGVRNVTTRYPGHDHRITFLGKVDGGHTCTFCLVVIINDFKEGERARRDIWQMQKNAFDMGGKDPFGR